MRVLGAISLWLLVAIGVCAQQCQPTPELAARAAVGEQRPAAPVTAKIGFQAQNLLYDPVLRRAWVRVARCGADGPSLLVPVALDPAIAAGGRAQEAPALVTRDVQTPVKRADAVFAGQPVRLRMRTGVLEMQMEGTALGSGAVGDSIEASVHLDLQSGATPEHRLRARVTGQGEAEVQP